MHATEYARGYGQNAPPRAAAALRLIDHTRPRVEQNEACKRILQRYTTLTLSGPQASQPPGRAQTPGWQRRRCSSPVNSSSGEDLLSVVAAQTPALAGRARSRAPRRLPAGLYRRRLSSSIGRLRRGRRRRRRRAQAASPVGERPSGSGRLTSRGAAEPSQAVSEVEKMVRSIPLNPHTSSESPPVTTSGPPNCSGRRDLGTKTI
jgi:hypothetical protein